ncbi:MAG: tRNA (adenosine(37)-N6)-threonylcarbamoyltransferase complex dimerization subunit type 1 TsaB [Candidatus Krumholzibacteriia bacterium]
MRILGIDTSHATGSVAVATDEGSITCTDFGAEASHLVELCEAVDGLLGGAGLDIADIDRVALVSGPGSFTGLRIGLAFVKGLFAARPLDVVTTTSLELLAVRCAHRRERVCVMVDARKDEAYAALYVTSGRYPDGEIPRVRAEIGPRAVSPGEFLTSLEICPTLFVGSGAVRYERLVRDTFGDAATMAEAHRPSTELLCRIAPALEPVDAGTIPELEPVYIRPSGAVLKPLRKMRNDG